MDKIDNIDKKEKEIFEAIKGTLMTINKLIPTEIPNLDHAVDTLRAIRANTYENINQLQHAALILKAARSLTGKYEDANWYWHPFQTGGADEPDLKANINEKTILSAEITTSENPVGTIDRRMNKTIKKLSKMEGTLYYFVQTKAMAVRAKTKIKKIGGEITVVNLGRMNQ